jgi:hypothetical protein
MKTKSIYLLGFLIPLFLWGQESQQSLEIKRNTVYIEAFGQGLYNSFTFDRLYHTDKKIKTSVSAGITLVPTSELFVLAIPVSYNFLFGEKNHHLELGIGLTAMYLREGNISTQASYIDKSGTMVTVNSIGHSDNFYSFVTPKIGYRFQRPAGGLFLRVTFTPPLAGINRLGKNEMGQEDLGKPETQFFTDVAFFSGYKIFPWGGLSIGWTFKK